jgi:large subunit ribosomal protein L25
MSKKYEINVKSRDTFGKCASRRARKAGMIPANIYMHGEACRPVLVDAIAWKALPNREISLIGLNEGEVKNVALIREIQVDALKNIVLHIDFQAVRMDEKIHATVSIHPAPGADPVGIAHGGILEQPLHTIEVSCVPNALPDSILIDLSKLEVDHSVHVKDLIMPEGVVAVTDADAVVFHMIKPSTAEATATAATAAPAAKVAAPAAKAAAPAAKAAAKPAAKAPAAKPAAKAAKK